MFECKISETDKTLCALEEGKIFFKVTKAVNICVCLFFFSFRFKIYGFDKKWATTTNVQPKIVFSS